MIIKMGTSYSPDTEGLVEYNKKAEMLAEELMKLLPNSSIYRSVAIEKSKFYNRTLIVLPKDLEAKLNNTNAKRLLCYLATQARKRRINFLLISPQMSSKNYSDKRLDYLTEIYIFSEHCIPELVELFKGANNVK